MSTRKVRTQACLVSSTLTAVRRSGVARAVLEGISRYVHPQEGGEEGVGAGVGGGGGGRPTYPVPFKSQADTHMWHNHDCFLDAVAGLLRSEGGWWLLLTTHNNNNNDL